MGGSVNRYDHRVRGLGLAAAALAGALGSSAVRAQVADIPEEQAVPILPEPVEDPLRINIADDPLIAFLSRTSPPGQFTSLVEQSVLTYPGVEETRYAVEEAAAARREARSALFPTIDLEATSRTSLVRNFSNDPDNVLERSRARGRTDATFALNQRLLDFGATSRRIDAAGYRLRAAMYERERQTDAVALRAIAAWYDVFTYRALVKLGQSLLDGELELQESVQYRIDQGVSARGDLARVQSEIASREAESARNRRQLADAEARFLELFGRSAPDDIARAPEVYNYDISRDGARTAALGTPAVRITQAQAYAARQDARADRADLLPHINGRVEGGRFGVFETDNDYDVRASVVLDYRLFGGGGDARADQSESRADQQEARARTVRDEALRLASIAWSDVEALEEQLYAVEESYLAARQSRDVILERFRYSRGTLFDALDTQSSYYSVASLYIQTVTELDAARFVLLSRTNQLIDRLGLEPDPQSRYRLAVP